MRLLVLLACIACAFLAGRALADKQNDSIEIAELLRKRHTKLMEDVTKIQKAGKDFLEIQAMRATGKYVLNRYELKMEKDGRMDFHIFMERYRNDTLETLALLDKLLGKQAYIDPLRKVFGDRLDEQVEIDWDGVNLQDIVDSLADQFNAEIDIDGFPEDGLTINFKGKMTLLAAVLQIENLFDVRMRVEGKKLWFEIPDREVAPKK
ncbi:MAG: hypothetical protein ACYTHK_12840 [Planctomycetota bacterium]|jgi:hypothetical protein